jgi:hypothetical protein
VHVIPAEYLAAYLSDNINLLAPEFGSYILAHPVCKMRIIQEQKKGSIKK